MQLDPAASRQAFALSAHDTLPSTNARSVDAARASAKPARSGSRRRQQTAGRGRRGNAWVSTRGNLYATLLLRDPAPADSAPELSFVAALAVHDAHRSSGRQRLREQLALKWPNDVLCGGAKLAGILIESESDRRRLARSRSESA